MKPEDFGKRTLARNPLIASLLLRAKYIEKLGTGIYRMRQEMIKAELPEPVFSFDGFFTIAFNRVHKPEKAIAVSLNVGTKRLERIMYLLRQLQVSKDLDISKTADRFNVHAKNIRNDLLLLDEKGWIISTGTTRNRTYQLSERAIVQLDTLEKA